MIFYYKSGVICFLFASVFAVLILELEFLLLCALTCVSGLLARILVVKSLRNGN